MKSIVLGTFLILVTLGAGLVHGHLSARWGPSPDLLEAGKKLSSIPTSFGEWEMIKEEKLADIVEKELDPYGYVQRVYQHKPSGSTVSFVVLLGRVGPISVHTPEICYSSRDYSLTSKREPLSPKTAAGEGDRLWDLTLKAKRATAPSLRVVYGWTCSGEWQAMERPRFSFAGSPFLYKLQIALAVPAEGDKTELCEEFLKEFLPILHPLLLKV